MEVVQSSREFYSKYKDHFTHIISIACPGDDSIEPIHERHLVLKFWDIDKTLKNKFRKYEVVDEETIRETIELAREWYLETIENDEPFQLLIHCDAGVSRSPALTLGVIWGISELIFDDPQDALLLREWLEARKEWCIARIGEDCVSLRRFMAGRYNPGVIPNQAVLGYLRNGLMYFPW